MCRHRRERRHAAEQAQKEALGGAGGAGAGARANAAPRIPFSVQIDAQLSSGTRKMWSPSHGQGFEFGPGVEGADGGADAGAALPGVHGGAEGHAHRGMLVVDDLRVGLGKDLVVLIQPESAARGMNSSDSAPAPGAVVHDVAPMTATLEDYVNSNPPPVEEVDIVGTVGDGVEAAAVNNAVGVDGKSTSCNGEGGLVDGKGGGMPLPPTTKVTTPKVQGPAHRGMLMLTLDTDAIVPRATRTAVGAGVGADAPARLTDYVFVVDRSGSMRRDDRIGSVRNALIVALSSLPAACKFNIVSFGGPGRYEAVFSESKPYNADNRATALRHVQHMAANMGGTAITQPLSAVLDAPLQEGEERRVLLLTDGHVKNTREVVDLVARARTRAGPALRVYTFGIGAAVSHALVDGVAKAGAGVPEYVLPGEPVRAKVIRQLSRAMEAGVASVTVDWGRLTRLLLPAPTKPQAVTTAGRDSRLVAPTVQPIVSTAGQRVVMYAGIDTSGAAPTATNAQADAWPTVATITVNITLTNGHAVSKAFDINLGEMRAQRLGVTATKAPTSKWYFPQLRDRRGGGEDAGELPVAVRTVHSEGQGVHAAFAKTRLRELETQYSVCSGDAVGDVARTTIKEEAVALAETFNVSCLWASFVGVLEAAPSGSASAPEHTHAVALRTAKQPPQAAPVPPPHAGRRRRQLARGAPLLGKPYKHEGRSNRRSDVRRSSRMHTGLPVAAIPSQPTSSRKKESARRAKPAASYCYSANGGSMAPAHQFGPRYASVAGAGYLGGGSMGPGRPLAPGFTSVAGAGYLGGYKPIKQMGQGAAKSGFAAVAPDGRKVWIKKARIVTSRKRDSADERCRSSSRGSVEDDSLVFDLVTALALEQDVAGFWVLNDHLSRVLGRTYDEFITQLPRHVTSSPQSDGKVEEQPRTDPTPSTPTVNEDLLRVWGTALVLAALRTKAGDKEEEWRLLADKALTWLASPSIARVIATLCRPGTGDKDAAQGALSCDCDSLLAWAGQQLTATA